jgi:nucleoside 2-deoxyribosyltransferase
MKRIYIAGPMRGLPQYNFPAFREATAAWRSKGWDVVSPAEMDESIGFTENSPTPNQEFLKDAMRRDVEAILSCDAIALLADWKLSKGVAVEVALAEFLGLPIWSAYAPQEPK